MRTKLLIGMFFIFLACVVPSRVPCVACETSPALTEQFIGVSHGLELAKTLPGALAAFADCNSSIAALIGAGFYGLEKIDLVPGGRSRSRKCLRIIRWTQETPTIVAIYLSPSSGINAPGADDYVIFANYDGQRWRFSWPAILGPDLGY